MVDVFGTIPAIATIDGPLQVHVTDRFSPRLESSALSLFEGDFLSGEFGHPLMVSEITCRETAFSVDS